MSKYILFLLIFLPLSVNAADKDPEPVPGILLAAGWLFSQEPRTEMCIWFYPKHKALFTASLKQFFELRQAEFNALEKTLTHWKGEKAVLALKTEVTQHHRELVAKRFEQGLFTEKLCTDIHAKRLSEGYIEPMLKETFDGLKNLNLNKP